MPDSGAVRQRRYRERHREIERERSRQWRRANQLHVVQYRALKYARDRVQETREKAEELYA